MTMIISNSNIITEMSTSKPKQQNHYHQYPSSWWKKSRSSLSAVDCHLELVAPVSWLLTIFVDIMINMIICWSSSLSADHRRHHHARLDHQHDRRYHHDRLDDQLIIVLIISCSTWWCQSPCPWARRWNSSSPEQLVSAFWILKEY